MAREIDKRWAEMDSVYHIAEQAEKHGYVSISAAQMHAMRERQQFAGRKYEPRLLTHFDTRQQQPRLFLDNGLSILPASRGTYVIGKFDPFQTIDKKPEEVPIRRIPALGDWETLRPDALRNETMGLNYAEAHGVIADFLGEDVVASVAGRQKGGRWNYGVSVPGGTVALSAEDPQIEIDGGYEGSTSIALFEAKNKLVNEFCLRQLYFPYRAWSNKVSKPVRSVFAAISGAEIYLYEYRFPDPKMLGASLVRCARYMIESDAISKQEIVDIFNTTAAGQEPNAPFPQANSPVRTMDIIERLAESNLSDGIEVSIGYLAETYGFDERQGKYYGDSACYLGYAIQDGGNAPYEPTEKAELYSNMTQKAKYLDFCRSLFATPVFHEVFAAYLHNGVVPHVSQIAPIIERQRPELSRGTPPRRASTVRSWVKWIVGLWGE